MEKVKYLIVIMFFLSFILTCGQNSKENNKNEGGKMTLNLPEPKLKGSVSLEECLAKRRSTRSYKEENLSIEEISQLLWSAYGITKEIENAPEFLRGGLRTAPSAGALYPLEQYLLVAEVEGLEAGIYKYNSERHTLTLIKKGDRRKELASAALSQRALIDAPAVIIYSAIFSRTTGKYGERGRERYVCIDLGHSAQNVCLQATALGLGICTIGAFNDDDVKKVVGMSDEEEAMFLLPIGKI